MRNNPEVKKLFKESLAEVVCKEDLGEDENIENEDSP
jgi:hypothetical protein